MKYLKSDDKMNKNLYETYFDNGILQILNAFSD